MTEKSVWLITVGALFLLGLYEAPATRRFRGADQITAPIELRFSNERNAESIPKQNTATVPCHKAEL